VVGVTLSLHIGANGMCKRVSGIARYSTFTCIKSVLQYNVLGIPISDGVIQPA
jgi:hypothetical protein